MADFKLIHYRNSGPPTNLGYELISKDRLLQRGLRCIAFPITLVE